MDGSSKPDFAEYLRLRRRRQPIETIPEYEAFLGRIDDFFRLRALAEAQWKTQPNRAYGRNGALPLHWEEIAEVLRGGDGPPARLIVRIAGERFVDVSSVGGNLRKTLLRLRERTPLGRVQQVDVACLRWLTRQPGRSAVEKAGATQRILGIVRRENFDTLENRVLKDFLLRAAGQCGVYLDEFGTRYPGHASLEKIRRFRNLCLGVLETPVFDGIRGLDQLPTPNYVLQQERHYSKIWRDYTLLVRQEHTATRLWSKRTEVDEAWLKLHGEWPEWKSGSMDEGGLDFHTNALAECDTPLWFNALDGRESPLERPFWGNRLEGEAAHRKYERPTVGDLAVVDLTGSGVWRELLVYGKRQNEKPHLQHYERPNIEPAREWWTLTELLYDVVNCPSSTAMARLRDYFEQLAPELGAERWVVLVPDDWSAAALERLLSAIPLHRSNVFLLWRSVAACLDVASRLTLREGGRVAVLDGQTDGTVMVSKLEWAGCDGRLVPRRRSFRRTGADAFRRYGMPRIQHNASWSLPNIGCSTEMGVDAQKIGMFIRDCSAIVITGVSSEKFARDVMPSEMSALTGNVEAGARIFDVQRHEGQVPYYDELEGLYLVVTQKKGYDEKPIPVALVEANERFPGGEEYVGKEIGDFTLCPHETSVRLYLTEGEVGEATPFKLSTTFLEKETLESERLLITTRMTPGQGLAQCTFRFESGRLPRPVRIDLAEIKDPAPGEPRTLLEIEERMPQSYPPDLPLVEASGAMFERVRPALEAYMLHGQTLDGKLFAHPRYRALPPNPSPIDHLRQDNVFGNAPGKELPQTKVPFNFDALFGKLARDFKNAGNNDKGFLHLIAWTYQSCNLAFRPITARLLCTYEQENTPGFGMIGFSALANLCSSPHDLKRLFATLCQKHIPLWENGRESPVSLAHTRLLYRILQFHPEVLKEATTYDCMALMEDLQRQYRLRQENEARYLSFNALLRAMLFLLNRRRYDPEFYRVHWDEGAPPDWISMPLGTARTEALRKSFIAYVCGKGRLEGIPRDED